MTTDEEIKTTHQNLFNPRWIGFCLLFAGGILLVQRSGIPLPFKIIFNWQLFLIIFGFVIGIKHRFRGAGWFMIMLVGAFFYINDYYPQLILHQYLWPAFLIVIGLVFILRPHNYKRYKYFENWDYWKGQKDKWKQQYKNATASGEDYIDITTVFSSTKKNIFSKDFKGGEAVSIMGGIEIDLSQADINGRVVLELTQVLGGTKLIVPSHWDVRTTELVSIFGGVEDKRSVDSSVIDPNKVLILKGTSVLGGIEIRNY